MFRKHYVAGIVLNTLLLLTLSLHTNARSALLISYSMDEGESHRAVRELVHGHKTSDRTSI